ncbi:hypothetical protein [Desulfovibrio oxyclinae]|uniref:hypothetical protein n=1 Tax=Desulfovibrio oxyclinae TaxID=63560 RepID=UPI00036E596B|nr:hypothetical protein [Desulfovibrio oxyclinae]
MEKIERLDWVKSAIIIDDEWEQVKDLNYQLSANGIATIYVNPNPAEDAENVIDSFPENTLSNFGLVFLDIDLGHGHSFKNQVSFVVGALNEWLSPECGPYGVVVWSREEGVPTDEGQDALFYINKAFDGKGFEKPKPLFVTSLDKPSFLTKSDLFRTLTAELKNKLSDSKLASFFSAWQAGVLDSTAESYNYIRDCAEVLTDKVGNSVEDNFLDVVKHATYKHFGFPSKPGDEFEKVLSKFSFCYISHILFDKMNSRFSTGAPESIYDDSIDSVQKVFNTRKLSVLGMKKLMEKTFKANGHGLQKRSLKDIGKKIEKISAKTHENIEAYDDIVARLNFIEIFEVLEGKDGEGLSGTIYRKGGTNKLLINITPPCDVANCKAEGEICLAGSMYMGDTINRARKKHSDNKHGGQKLFLVPPAKFADKFIVLKFNLTKIQRDKDITYKSFLRMKDSTFNDLMQRFGYHNSRLGARNL